MCFCGQNLTVMFTQDSEQTVFLNHKAQESQEGEKAKLKPIRLQPAYTHKMFIKNVFFIRKGFRNTSRKKISCHMDLGFLDLEKIS